MVRQPEPLLAGIRQGRTADANGAMTIRARRPRCGSQPEHGTLARRVRVAPGREGAHPLRDHLELSARRDLLVRSRPAWRSRICRGAADLAQLLCDAMVRFTGERRRGVPAVGRARGCDLGLSRFPVRVLAPSRDHRRGIRHAWRCCAVRPSSVSKAGSFGAGRASISARDRARAVAPMSGTISRRSPGCFRRSNGRCAKPSSRTTSCRTAA